ncbi:MAG: GNAT family N-acetyltransferase [Deltaproteobacteria bacterium]|nr:GNAT family N-acetyltransferase [Deltaproteobacteria bacterium]
MSVVRVLQRRDFAAVDALLEAERDRFARASEHLASAEERSLDAEADPTIHCLVAIEEEVAVGFIEWHAADPGRAVLAAIVVSKHVRRVGLGRELVRRSLEALEEARGELEELELGVHTDNERALSFFESLGFRSVRRARGVIDLVASIADVRAALHRATYVR